MNLAMAAAVLRPCIIAGTFFILCRQIAAGAEPLSDELPIPDATAVSVPEMKLFVFDKIAPRHESTSLQADLKQPALPSESAEKPIPGSTGGAVGAAGQSESGSVAEFEVTIENESLLSEASLQSFASMNGGPVLRQVLAPEPLGGAAGWVQQKVWDPVFAPETVKLGKVYLTGGVVAAIKRKNPFCLLHPLVFAASW